MGGFVKSVGSSLGIGGGHEAGGYGKALGLYGNDKPLSAPDLQKLSLQNLGPSAFGGLHPDSISTGAENTSLDQLGQMATSQDLSAGDQAHLNQIAQQQRVTDQGQQEAIDQNAKMRGLSGSGIALASKLGASQGTSNQANQAGTQVLAGNSDRRLQAASLLGGLGASIGGQRWSEGAQQATAADEISRYNNGLQNSSRIYNTTQLPQQNFNNRLSLVQDKANLLAKRGVAQQAQDARAGQTLGNTVMGIGQAIGFSDKRLKKNINPKADMSKFLDGISASSFEYKDPSHGEGKHAGPMAQELESTDLGKSAVIDTPVGKMVHGAKLAGLSLASSKHLHERLKKLEGK